MGKTMNGEFKDSPTICIEIKAKQGYLMDDDDVNGVMKCRYCYFQVKLKLGFWGEFLGIRCGHLEDKFQCVC